MKKIIFTILLSTAVFSLQAQKCDKNFKKQKQKSSSAFGENNTITSKWIKFYNEGARDMYLKFTNMNGDQTLIIQQQTTQNLQFKQAIELGRLIRIAMVFEDESIYIIQFENAQEDLGVILDKFKTSRNSLTISEELATHLKSSNLKLIEIKNAFSSSNINADKIIKSEASRSDKIKFVYNCFVEKIK